MFEIPIFLLRDDYLQNPIMKRFLRDRNILCPETRADYKNEIEKYANLIAENEIEVRNWLLKVVKEGSKEFCYKKVYQIGENHLDPILLKHKIDEAFQNCPHTNILNYNNTYERTLIDFDICTDDKGKSKIVSFTFSRHVLFGEKGAKGDITVLPIFVDLFLDEGFIVSRVKAKSTIFNYTESKILSADNNICSAEQVSSVNDTIIAALDLGSERDKKIIMNNNSRMLYNIYEEFTFTPKDIEEKVKNSYDISKAYIEDIFSHNKLSILNKEKAILDLNIFVEKYVSINGDYENVFKKDRDAYLVKISAEDELDLTSFDAKSEKAQPLQCTDTFFDSKKSVIKGKKCKKINLIYKRKDDRYLKSTPLCVQFSSKKIFGLFKTMQYAEEADINNVLQTIFRNYKRIKL